MSISMLILAMLYVIIGVCLVIEARLRLELSFPIPPPMLAVLGLALIVTFWLPIALFCLGAYLGAYLKTCVARMKNPTDKESKA